MHWHHWMKWEVKQRQVTIATQGLLDCAENVGKTYTEEYQERRCVICGLTQRKAVSSP